MSTLNYSLFAEQPEEPDYYLRKQKANKETSWKLNRSLIAIGILMFIGLIIAIVTYTVEYEDTYVPPIKKGETSTGSLLLKSINKTLSVTSAPASQTANKLTKEPSNNIPGSQIPGSNGWLEALKAGTPRRGFESSPTPGPSDGAINLTNERIYLDVANDRQMFHIPGHLSDTYIHQNFKMGYQMIVTLLKKRKASPGKVFFCKTSDLEGTMRGKNITVEANGLRERGFDVILPPNKMPIFNYRSCDEIPITFYVNPAPFYH